MMMTGRERVAAAIRMAAELASAGANIEDVLTNMRASGFSAGHCVIALTESGLCAGGEAKTTVLRSPVWADIVPVHERIVREVEEELTRDS
nr:hypothetical protein [Kibdelosporangium sp. MJ126-NF4]